MEIIKSIESVRDFTVDVFHAGRLACATFIEKVDTALANALNGDEDE